MHIQSHSTALDTIVIGGSYAGLSAALQLARARRQVLVVDAGLRRNRFAATSHGFLGQDGRPPGDIATDARAQLLAYPSVRWVDGTVAHAARATPPASGFAVRLATGDTLQASSLVLSTGVVDLLPPIDGLAARWGQSIFHCPYCHGYELNQGRIGVLASSALAMHHALLLPDWGPVTLFTNGSFTPDAEQAAALLARGVTIRTQPVLRIEDMATVVLQDGPHVERVAMDGLFTITQTRMASPVAEQLGCAFDDGPVGPYIRTDAMQETTVPGVFACGDAARMFGNVALAVGGGAAAGAAAHQFLVFGENPC